MTLAVLGFGDHAWQLVAALVVGFALGLLAQTHVRKAPAITAAQSDRLVFALLVLFVIVWSLLMFWLPGLGS